MFAILGLFITLAVTALGYWQAKQFTQTKLRYVDAIHKAIVPVGVGIAAFLVAIPVVALLPIIGTGTALLFGGGVAMGVAAGARDVRKRIGA